MKLARDNCLTLAKHWVWSAFNFALLKAINNSEARMAMIAMTTSSSISVKPMLLLQRGRIVRLLE
jgi:hypothetical protein